MNCSFHAAKYNVRLDAAVACLLPITTYQMCHLNWNITWADVAHKLLNCTFCHDLRKYYFSARIINIWNSLPNCVVDVSTINQFKVRLDKFWMHQDVLYDYTADLTGIGDRSVHVTKDV